MNQPQRHEILRELWTRVLAHEHVAPTDNFFDLGGDSIKAMKLIVEARQRGLVVTLTQVFECESLSDLAAAAEVVAT